MRIIPIGIQCGNTIYLKSINQRKYAYPFDHIICTPKFIFDMLELLLDRNIDIEDLVKNHFFRYDKRVLCNSIEHYYTNEESGYVYNTKYTAIFPHDLGLFQDSVTKYIRRFERLKFHILDTTEEICLFYISQSSLSGGNFTIDGVCHIVDPFVWLNRIHELVNKYRLCKMLVIDTIQCDKNILNENITLIQLPSFDDCKKVLAHMETMEINF